MPYKRKDSPIWWVSYADQSGQRVRRSTGTTDRKEAEALEAKWKLDTFRTKQWDEPPPRTFEEVALYYLQAKKDMRSYEDLKLFTKTLRTHFGGRVMNTLRPTDISEYIGKRISDGLANGSVNRELEVLSASINLVNRDLEWDLPNPVSGRKLKEPVGRLRWLTVKEANSLLEAASKARNAPHLVDFITIALHTGMRRNEILRMEWERVDFHAGLMHLGARHTKSARRRDIPINKIARHSLIQRMRFRAKYCPDSPWVFCRRNGERIQEVRSSFATACRVAGIKDFRVHDLRHTCAAWLVSSGVPLSEVRDLLGHSAITVTERYAHLAPENVKAAVSRLEDIESRSGHAGDDQEKEVPVKPLINWRARRDSNSRPPGS